MQFGGGANQAQCPLIRRKPVHPWSPQPQANVMGPVECPGGGSRGSRRMPVAEGPRRIPGRRPIVRRNLLHTLPHGQASMRRPAKCPDHRMRWWANQGPRPSEGRTSSPLRQGKAGEFAGCPGDGRSRGGGTGPVPLNAERDRPFCRRCGRLTAGASRRHAKSVRTSSLLQLASVRASVECQGGGASRRGLASSRPTEACAFVVAA